jgi:hypothetical protein
MRRALFLALAGMLMMIGTSSFAVDASDGGLGVPSTPTGNTIVQIYGRMCEYHRDDVEAALRAFSAVRRVEFLNDHGTVLVHYLPGHETSEQFAGAVDRACGRLELYSAGGSW